MKKLILALVLFLTLNCFAQCPLEGDATLLKKQQGNKLKNREIVYSPIDSSVTLKKMLVKGSDFTRFKESSFVRIEGYVILVKDGGEESCNCHSEEKDDHDVHIQIALKLKANKNETVIVEVTPKFKKLHPNFDYKNLVGKKVIVIGYLFADIEHKQNATNTCTTCGNAWRATIWEIHPVVNIKIK